MSFFNKFVGSILIFLAYLYLKICITIPIFVDNIIVSGYKIEENLSDKVWEHAECYSAVNLASDALYDFLKNGVAISLIAFIIIYYLLLL